VFFRRPVKQTVVAIRKAHKFGNDQTWTHGWSIIRRKGRTKENFAAAERLCKRSRLDGKELLQSEQQWMPFLKSTPGF